MYSGEGEICTVVIVRCVQSVFVSGVVSSASVL